jgi:hypothetical protein
MQVLEKAGEDICQAAQPFGFLRLQLAFAVHDANVDLQPVLVRQQFLRPVVEFEEGLIRINRSAALLIISSRE